jgi:hypothetical protein
MSNCLNKKVLCFIDTHCTLSQDEVLRVRILSQTDATELQLGIDKLRTVDLKSNASDHFAWTDEGSGGD